ncbi:DinB family protein [Bernardetia sp. OM2101]|uniref:DinB family protein n=1 Tax=Bernardetia sp. OM2101 TaxID=3344876 RepID=UPI0035CEB674
MNKEELIDQICQHHYSFIDYINSLNDEEFEQSVFEKWTAGQQTEHILISIKPITKAFLLPNLLLKMVIGKSNREGYSYNEIVDKYHIKLEEGGKAPSNFLPKKVLLNQKSELLKSLKKVVFTLSTQINDFSEEQLDTLLLPHPLLGKLTLREMMYFTIYHVQHHHKKTIENLKKDTVKK